MDQDLTIIAQQLYPVFRCGTSSDLPQPPSTVAAPRRHTHRVPLSNCTARDWVVTITLVQIVIAALKFISHSTDQLAHPVQ